MEDKARVPVAIKPVAYVYSKPGMQVEFRLCTERCFAGDGWTEEPLFASPPAVPGEVHAQLALIKHLAEYTTEKNWADKRLYIMQAVDRALSAPAPLPCESNGVECQDKTGGEAAAENAFMRAQQIKRAGGNVFRVGYSWETLSGEVKDCWRSIAKAAREGIPNPFVGTENLRELRKNLREPCHGEPIAWTSALELRRMKNGNYGRIQSEIGGDFTMPLFQPAASPEQGETE